MRTAVAIALYNGEKFIEKQLDSLRNQTQAPDQVVMCDDGSTDRTVEIVKKYIEKYGLEKNWVLSQNQKNLGYIKNFYHAISLCDAELVFLSDQDDVWDADKVSKMNKIMEQRKEVMLLSCKYGIIDAEGNRISSIMERKVHEDDTVCQISIRDIMRAYRWPGMVMCIRKQFFNVILKDIVDVPVPHDLAFAICAADKKSFYEYNYLGAYHRRHDNNVAREEHRVFKLLNLERKLRDISELCATLHNIMCADWAITEQTRNLVNYKLQLQEKREDSLRNRNLKGIIRLYGGDSNRILRKTSFICDLWLVFFGKYK